MSLTEDPFVDGRISKCVLEKKVVRVSVCQGTVVNTVMDFGFHKRLGIYLLSR
jgi:hypothetical protein